VALRFVYDFQGGTYFPQTDRGIGWYLDDILVSSAEELIPEGDLNSVSSGTSFVFRPSAAGDYLLEVRPLVGDRPFPWGPALPLTATDNAPPELRILGLSREADGGWAIPFRSDGVSGTPQIESAQSVTGPWAPVTGVEVEPGA